MSRSRFITPCMSAMCPEPHSPARHSPLRRQRGFSLVTGIFLLVILAALGAFLVSVSGLFHFSATADLQGARAYQAARAGIEWGAFSTMTPPAPALAPACFGATNITFASTTLSDFTTTVTCAAFPFTEAGVPVTSYQIIATACNQPVAGACPNNAPGTSYVERQLQATLSR